MDTYKHLKLWSMPDNYAGELWPNHYSSGFGRTRDSDLLEESNFDFAWGKLSRFEDEGVTIVREGHWAVGWVEWIAIPADLPEALKIADDLCERRDQYPILDEEGFSRREEVEADRVWADCYSVSERVDYIRDHASQFEFRSFADMIACVRGIYFAGYASELLG